MQLAHGVGIGREDLPIPVELFTAGAITVLVVVLPGPRHPLAPPRPVEEVARDGVAAIVVAQRRAAQPQRTLAAMRP